MTVRAIVSGTLMKAAVKKTSQRGGDYLIISIRESHGGTSRFWTGLVFNEVAISVVERLQPGEPLAVAGEIEAEIYAPAGKEPRVSFSIKVDGVLNARRPNKRGAGDAPKSAPQIREREFDDAIPF